MIRGQPLPLTTERTGFGGFQVEWVVTPNPIHDIIFPVNFITLSFIRCWIILRLQWFSRQSTFELSFNLLTQGTIFYTDRHYDILDVELLLL